MSLLLSSTRLAAIFLSLAIAESVAQSPGAARAAELASAFSKSKHESRTVRGEHREKFREVISTPLSVGSPKDYSGSYSDEGLGAALDLAIDSTGRGAGWGKEPGGHGMSEPVRFTLENVRVDGAVLTATKKYEGGRSEPFEAVFLTRSDRSHPDSAATTQRGLGVELEQPLQLTSAMSVNRYFMRRQE